MFLIRGVEFDLTHRVLGLFWTIIHHSGGDEPVSFIEVGMHPTCSLAETANTKGAANAD